MAKNGKTASFDTLSKTDLEDWAGGKIVARGENYHRQGRVTDLARSADGGLLARVQGTEHYFTKVIMLKDGLPESVCSCPYMFECKHGVATVFEYIERVKNDKSVRSASEHDERLAENVFYGNGDYLLSEEETEEINAFLQKRTKAQLIELLNDLAVENTLVSQILLDNSQTAAGNFEPVLKRLQQDLDAFSYEPDLYDAEYDDYNVLNYSNVRQRMEMLLSAGAVDEVLELAPKLLDVVNLQLGVREASDYDFTEITSCMSAVAQALKKSSMDKAKKLELVMVLMIADPFEVCFPLEEYLESEHTVEEWETFAGTLLERLDAITREVNFDDISGENEQESPDDFTLVAINGDGRDDEKTQSHKIDTKKIAEYENQADQLIKIRRPEEAEHLIHRALLEIGKSDSDAAKSLHKKLSEIQGKLKE